METLIMCLCTMLLGLLVGWKVSTRIADGYWVNAAKYNYMIDIGDETYKVVDIWEERVDKVDDIIKDIEV